MAQFWDGLRPVWDPPHVAKIPIDPTSVDLINLTPNSFCPVTGKAGKESDTVIADVGDGCHPAYTTVIGRDSGSEAVEAFRAAMAAATIRPRNDRVDVMVGVEI